MPLTFVPDKPKKLEFVPDDQPRLTFVPDRQRTVDEKMADPAYIPTMDEWREHTSKGGNSLSFSEATQLIKDGVSGVKDDLVGAGSAGIELIKKRDIDGIVASSMEGAARGLVDVGLLGKKLSSAALDRLPGMNSEQAQYRRFVEIRKLNGMRSMAQEGKINILDDILEDYFDPEAVNTKLAEGFSYVADPTALAGGSGVGAKAARKAVGKGLAKTGKVTAVGAEALDSVATRVKDSFPAPVREVAGSGAAAMATVGTLAGVPGGAQSAAALTGRVALPAVKQAGDVVQAAGESIARGPSQMGVLESAAKNANLPDLARKAAAAGKVADPVIDRVGSVVRGAGAGAATGAIVGGATDGQEGALQGLGAGLAGGAAGSAVARGAKDVSGLTRKAKENGDIARMRQKHVEEGGLQPYTWASLGREGQLKVAQVENLLEGKVGVKLVEAVKFADSSANPGAAAFFDPIKQEIVVNAQSKTAKADLLHELGHAIFQSPVVDKTPLLSTLTRVYGPEAIEAMGKNYSRKLLESNAVANRRAAKKIVTKADIQSARNSVSEEAVNRSYNAFLKHDPTYFVNEIFAEHVLKETADNNLNKLRKRFPNAGVDVLARPLIEAKQQVLNALGVNVSATGHVNTLLGRVLSDDPKLKSDVRKYIRDVDKHLSGVKAVKKQKVDISTGEMFDAKQGTFAKGADGMLENELFSIEGEPSAPTRIIPKPAKEVRKQVAARAKEIKDVVPDGIVDSSNPDVARKLRDGKEEVYGTKLPDEVLDLPSMRFSREAAIKVQDAIASGDSIDSWVAVIGTGNWRNSVKRHKGNIPAEQYIYQPYEFFISKAGHANVRAIDWDHVRAKIDNWRAKGQLRLWGNDVGAFRDDVYKYFRNHQEGKPGGTGLTEDRKNVINAFYNLNNDSSNAFSKAFNKADPRIYKTLRLERILSAKPAQQKGHFFDFEKAKKNLRPELIAEPVIKPLNKLGGEMIVTEQGRAVRLNSRSHYRIYDEHGKRVGTAKSAEDAKLRLGLTQEF